MNPVLKEIIKSLRDNWQEWEYCGDEDVEHKYIHMLTNKKSTIGIYIARGGKRPPFALDAFKDHMGFRVSSSFRCNLGFFAKRRLTKAMEFCIAKIIAKKLEPEHGEPVGKAIRHLDLED